VSALPQAVPIEGPWRLSIAGVRFPRTELNVEKLVSWNTIPALEFCSGTGAYTTEFEWTPRAGVTCILDLGEVAYVADVEVNGTAAGVAWMQPYRLDITRFLRAGRNQLTVKVTNLLIHHVRGMKEMPPIPENLRERYGQRRQDYDDGLNVVQRDQTAEPVPPSGLLGPVRLLVV
jgi:hypothetical protein